MNKDTEEKLIMLLRTLSLHSNWTVREVYGRISGGWLRNEYLWLKEHYDPQSVAQELLRELGNDE